MAENILHFGGARFRLNGSGSLKLRLLSFDDATNYIMLPLTMGASPGREPLRTGNLVAQRARLEIKTTMINEIMKINRIVIFTRPIFFDYPSAS